MTIATLTGENGLLKKVEEAKENTERAQEKEQLQMTVLSIINFNSGTISQKDLESELNKNELLSSNNLLGEGPWVYRGNSGTYLIKQDGNVLDINIIESIVEDETITEGKELSLSWEQLYFCAEAIANSELVSNNTQKVIIELDNKQYEIRVGDIMTVDIEGYNTSFKVRILGFKHDTLAKKVENEKERKAGISFEFIGPLVQYNLNEKLNNTGGWGLCNVRNLLNGTIDANSKKIISTEGAQISKMSNSKYIKLVKKCYINSEVDKNNKYIYSVEECEDYLWLLSETEIHGKSAQISEKEGELYKYYKFNSSNEKKRKYKVSENNTVSYIGWWLRTPWYNSGYFSSVSSNGKTQDTFPDGGAYVSPGFSI